MDVAQDIRRAGVPLASRARMNTGQVGQAREDVKAKAIRAMRLVRDELTGQPEAQTDDARVERAVAAACTTVGITPQDYAAAVRGSPELTELERETLREALAGSTDPGPHDEISRESPSGQPGDLHKNRTHPIP